MIKSCLDFLPSIVTNWTESLINVLSAIKESEKNVSSLRITGGERLISLILILIASQTTSVVVVLSKRAPQSHSLPPIRTTMEVTLEKL